MKVIAAGLLLVATVAVAGYPPVQYVQDVKSAYSHRTYNARHGTAIGPRSEVELGLSPNQFKAAMDGATSDAQRRAITALHDKFEDCMTSAQAGVGEPVNAYYNRLTLCDGALATAGDVVVAAAP